MTQMVNLYTLSDPKTNDIRYVGKTIFPLEKRLNGHLKIRGRARSVQWIKSLKNQGLSPKIELVDVVSEDNWIDEEKFYISYFRFLGFDLTNLTDGGEGYCGIKMTEDAKRKSLETRKNSGRSYTMSLDNKIKIKEGIAAAKKRNGGSVYTQECKKIMSLKKKGIKYSEERKIQMTNARDMAQQARKKPVEQYDVAGNFIAMFPSLKAAAASVNTTHSNLYLVINGINKTAKGYVWKYKNNSKKLLTN